MVVMFGTCVNHSLDIRLADRRVLEQPRDAGEVQRGQTQHKQSNVEMPRDDDGNCVLRERDARAPALGLGDAVVRRERICAVVFAPACTDRGR